MVTLISNNQYWKLGGDCSYCCAKRRSLIMSEVMHMVCEILPVLRNPNVCLVDNEEQFLKITLR